MSAQQSRASGECEAHGRGQFRLSFVERLKMLCPELQRRRHMQTIKGSRSQASDVSVGKVYAQFKCIIWQIDLSPEAVRAIVLEISVHPLRLPVRHLSLKQMLGYSMGPLGTMQG